jgi:predicted phosphodiesterase
MTRATWPRAKLEEAIAVLGKSQSLDDACKRLRVGRHKLRRAFNAVGLTNPSYYLAGSPWSRKLLADIDWDKMPEIIREPQVVPREPEPRKIQPPPSWEPKIPKPSPLKKPLKNAPEYTPAYTYHPRRPPLRNEAAVAVVISDIHRPYENRWVYEAALEITARLQPSIFVVNGDAIDFYEISRYNELAPGNLEGKRIVETWDSARLMRQEIDQAAGAQCKDKRFHYGNHEGRLDDWLKRGGNSVFKGDPAFSIDKRLGLSDNGWKVYPGERQGSYLGHLWVTHGHICKKDHNAKHHLNYYRHTVMVGHTHRPDYYYVGALHSQQVGICAGHMADISADAVRYNEDEEDVAKWMHGFLVVSIYEDNSFTFEPVVFWNERATFGGQQYGRKVSTASTGNPVAGTLKAGGRRWR